MKPARKILPFVYLAIGIIAWLTDRSGRINGIESENTREIAEAILWVGKLLLYIAIPWTLYVIVRMAVSATNRDGDKRSPDY